MWLPMSHCVGEFDFATPTPLCLSWDISISEHYGVFKLLEYLAVIKFKTWVSYLGANFLFAVVDSPSLRSPINRKSFMESGTCSPSRTYSRIFLVDCSTAELSSPSMFKINHAVHAHPLPIGMVGTQCKAMRRGSSCHIVWPQCTWTCRCHPQTPRVSSGLVHP